MNTHTHTLHCVRPKQEEETKFVDEINIFFSKLSGWNWVRFFVLSFFHRFSTLFHSKWFTL